MAPASPISIATIAAAMGFKPMLPPTVIAEAELRAVEAYSVRYGTPPTSKSVQSGTDDAMRVVFPSKDVDILERSLISVTKQTVAPGYIFAAIPKAHAKKAACKFEEDTASR